MRLASRMMSARLSRRPPPGAPIRSLKMRRIRPRAACLAPARNRGPKASGVKEEGARASLRLTPSNALQTAEVQPINKEHDLRCANEHQTTNLGVRSSNRFGSCRLFNNLYLRFAQSTDCPRLDDQPPHTGLGSNQVKREAAEEIEPRIYSHTNAVPRALYG
jgi:hypothetical protein